MMRHGLANPKCFDQFDIVSFIALESLPLEIKPRLVLIISERKRTDFLTEMTLVPPPSPECSTDAPILIMEAARFSEMALTSYHTARFTTQKAAI
jgi:hypothetical protein